MSKTKLLVYSYEQNLPDLIKKDSFMIFSPSPQRKNSIKLRKKITDFFTSIDYNDQYELPINFSIQQLTQLRKELKNPQNRDAQFLKNQQISIQQIDDIVFSDE